MHNKVQQKAQPLQYSINKISQCFLPPAVTLKAFEGDGMCFNNSTHTHTYSTKVIKQAYKNISLISVNLLPVYRCCWFLSQSQR